MTTANLLNVSPNKGVQVDVSKRLQEEAREVTEIFASMMNQTVDAANRMVDDLSSETGISKTEGMQSATESYERYGYKSNQIETVASGEEVAELSQETVDAMETAEEEIIKVISDAYGVDEEQIRNLLNELNLNVLDLLDLKNLVTFMMALTGVFSSEELLLDENFLKVLETVENETVNLMKRFDVDKQGLAELVAQMETITVENENVIESEDVATLLVGEEATQAENNKTAETVITVEKTEENREQVQSVQNDETAVSKETVAVEQEVAEVPEKQQEKPNTVLTEKETVETVAKHEMSFSENQDREPDSFLNQESQTGRDAQMNQAMAIHQTVTNTVQGSDMPQMQFQSYMSTETLHIMEQLAEQIKVVVTPDTTSMEMQLNPENLGKVYLHISSQEGVVNAQFYATNEVVKEALETQVATLRENLNQAGVKVDAIEVTIESHEFERNLEQNQRRDEEQKPVNETSKRRNLSLESLDELTGVMTEEENLVAQIMRDNGNSIDFTA